MRVVIARKPLVWAQRVLFTIAFLLIGYCAFTLISSSVFQHQAKLELKQKPEVLSTPRLEEGDVIGEVDVDRLGVSVAVVEGAEEEDLKHAAGHISGTALPGESGNVGIAAHRDTFFRPLRKIQKGDVIRVTTPAGEYRYSVVTTKIVSPDDVSVLASDNTETLTLVTCYPFYFVGSAPNRFIVRATFLDRASPAETKLQPVTAAQHL